MKTLHLFIDPIVRLLLENNADSVERHKLKRY